MNLIKPTETSKEEKEENRRQHQQQRGKKTEHWHRVAQIALWFTYFAGPINRKWNDYCNIECAWLSFNQIHIHIQFRSDTHYFYSIQMFSEGMQSLLSLVTESNKNWPDARSSDKK